MSTHLKEVLAETIRNYNAKGWSPATSTNYSFVDDNDTIWVSKSGIDKAQFTSNDFLEIDASGNPLDKTNEAKPSAETLIHCAIYELFPETKIILHSHSIYPVLLSGVAGIKVTFQGYEIQKGFEGVTSHEAVLQIPIFENTQNMEELKTVLLENKNKINYHSFLIQKHGTYAWGRTLFEAKRHLETLEYLCQCEWEIRKS
jgi:methylthioribulose-1-phosphate dehydratase